MKTSEKEALSNLKRDITRAQKQDLRPPPPPPSNAMGLALRIISDLVAAVVIGTGMGWGLDYLTGLAPLFLVLFFFMGLAAGVFNVMKTAREMNHLPTESKDNDEI